MFCSVSFSFYSNRKPMKKNLVYKSDCVSIKTGDIVEVDYRGTLHMAVVNSVFDKDEYNYLDMPRKNINRKLHTNTAKAALRKRFNEFKDIRIRTERKSGRILENRVIKILGEDYQRRILKYVCLGNSLLKKDGRISFIYANNTILLQKDKHGNYIIIYFDKHKEFNKKWLTPNKYKEYYDQLYSEYVDN